MTVATGKTLRLSNQEHETWAKDPLGLDLFVERVFNPGNMPDISGVKKLARLDLDPNSTFVP